MIPLCDASTQHYVTLGENGVCLAVKQQNHFIFHVCFLFQILKMSFPML